MKKLKLITATFALLLGWSSASAKTDVTSTYLTDAALENEAANWNLTSNGGNHNWNGTYKYHESWHNTFSLSQTVTIPNGYYQISIQAMNQQAPTKTALLTATSGENSASTYIKHATGGSFDEISGWFSNNIVACRIYATVKVENGSLTVGLSQTNGEQWMVYGQFKLYSLTEAEYDNAVALETAIESKTDAWSSGWSNEGNLYKLGRERFNEVAYETGKVLYRTFSDLPTGKYDVTVHAKANKAWHDVATGNNIAEVYANDGKCSIPVDDMTGFDPTPTYNYTLEDVVVSDGNLEVGIRNIATGGNWYVISLVNLLYKGEDLADYETPLVNAKAAAIAVNQEAPMNATVLSALQTAITNYGSKPFEDYTTVDAIREAITALNTAATNATTSISNYEEAVSILNAASSLDAAGQAYYAANETVAGIKSAYDARTLESVSSDQKAACAAVLPLAAREQTTDNADWTAVIVNPSFETGDFTGWDSSGMGIQGNNSFAKVGKYYAETWQPNGTKSVIQTVDNIAAGVYSISAKAYARDATSAKIFAADKEQIVTVNADADTYTVEFLQSKDGSVTFGYEAIGDGTANSWICVDNFTMKFVRAATAEDYKVLLASTISAASSARKSSNEGTGVFQIPAAAGSALADAISTAQGVYNDAGATISDVTTAVSTLNTAVETYESATLNAPDAEKRYDIILRYDGYEYDGKAMTYLANSRDDMGKYNIQYKAAPNANYAQAFTLTQVSGNTYKMSQTDVDGNTRYLCTGIQYGGNSNQIRTTTTAGDALVVKIIATETKNVFNIYNTEANDYIGSQDAGVYTVNSHINFTIAEAAQASVNVTIAADVKFATRIFPFKPALPAGIKAYSIESAADGVITLAEVAAPAANTPYILFAEAGYTGDALTGFGTAGATTYTANNMTGVYEATTSQEGWYVLQNNGGKVGFYQVGAEVKPTIAANRCYFTGPSSARAFIFDMETTAINAINALTTGETEIYDLNGVKQNRLQKGMNIVNKNGKTFKVMVK